MEVGIDCYFQMVIVKLSFEQRVQGAKELAM